MGTLLQDLRYGLRMLAKNPGFTAVAVITLALGIGANTAIFQLLDAVRLRTLPVKNPQELVLVQLADRTGWRGNQQSFYPALTNPLWEYLRDHEQAFSGVLAWGSGGFSLAHGGEGRQARGLWVSGNLFQVLGVQPILGRVFAPADDHRGCGLPGVVISYALWQQEFGGDASVVGKKLTLNYHPVEVIGVTPASFYGLEIGHSFDIAVPICSQTALWSEGDWVDASTVWWLTVMGRLKPGWSLAQANTYLRAASPATFEATLREDYPAENVKDYLRFKLQATPAPGGVSWLRSQYGDPLWMLLGLAGLVLLIACANLANLLLARASAREREIAVRLALGAPRGRLIQQLLAESLMLASVGAAFGLMLASTLSQFLVAFLNTQGDPLFVDLNLDWRVLAYTATLAILTCVLFGLTPALRATCVDPGEAMKVGGRGMSEGRKGLGLRRSLVVAQVALSLVLLVGAVLFSRTLSNLLALDAGFRQDGILIAWLDLSRLRLPIGRRLPMNREILYRLRAIPGVDSAAESWIVPLSGSSIDNDVWLDGSDSQERINSKFNWVSPGYFKTLGTPLVLGRDFDDRDTSTSTKVAIVNEAFALKLGLAGNPVGRRFRRQATPHEPELLFEIVGMVKDTKYRSLRQDFGPIVYLSTSQDQSPKPFDQILIHSGLPLAGITSQVKGALTEVSPDIGIDFRVFKTQIRDALLRERLIATLSGFFGVLAGLLTAIGLYGAVSYMVTRRTNEIGIRMALGAQQSDVLHMVLREALRLALIGIAIGLPCALGALRLVSSMLFGLKPDDPMTIGLATVVIIAVALAAGYWPARRATKVDPMVALRYE